MASTGLDNTPASEKLTCISYNCEYANKIRLPFLKHLFSQCAFLFIQEHGLFKSKLSWFQNLGKNVGVHGVSAMDEGRIVRGRPRGGAAIVWHGSLGNRVTPVPWDSTRLCAVTLEVDTEKILLVCVYMPCDDGLNNQNVLEYKDILDSIDILCRSTNTTMLCIGGDFNTDVRRNNPQTQAMNAFCIDNDLFCCARNVPLNLNFTYCSKINGCQTFIDHFVISDNLRDKLLSFSSIDSIKTPSDHSAIKCCLDVSLCYSEPNVELSHIARPVWDSAGDCDITKYKDCLNDYLLNIPLPLELLQCNNNMCTRHFNDISKFHDSIIDALVTACNVSIPVSKCKSKAKVVPGWNDNVEHFFQTALFWHRLWIEKDRPETGIIADIRRMTRSKYHKARKLLIKNSDLVKSEKLAESLANDTVVNFGKMLKKVAPQKILCRLR